VPKTWEVVHHLMGIYLISHHHKDNHNHKPWPKL